MNTGLDAAKKALVILFLTFGFASSGCHNLRGIPSDSTHEQTVSVPSDENQEVPFPNIPPAASSSNETTGGLTLAGYQQTGGNEPSPPAAPGHAVVAPEQFESAVQAGPAIGPAGPLPTELAPVSHPAYTVAPPDILIITADPLRPRAYVIRPFDVMEINAVRPEQDMTGKTVQVPIIVGDFTVTSNGNVILPLEGSPAIVRVAGKSIEQATKDIDERLRQVWKRFSLSVKPKQFQGVQPLAGEFLVAPDGTINLGAFGPIHVAGMNLGQIQYLVEQRLGRDYFEPRVSVTVRSYNSKKYYLIVDGGGYGQLVYSFPYTGYETVLDGVSRLNGLPWWASKKKIWVARPSPANNRCQQVLPVDWDAITQGGVTKTNYQLMPGDRIYVRADCLVQTDNYLNKILTPINRVLNSVLLGASVNNTIQNRDGSNVGFVATVP